MEVKCNYACLWHVSRYKYTPSSYIWFIWGNLFTPISLFRPFMSTLALHIANGDQNDYLKVETTPGCLGWSFDLNYKTQIVHLMQWNMMKWWKPSSYHTTLVLKVFLTTECEARTMYQAKLIILGNSWWLQKAFFPQLSIEHEISMLLTK